MLRRQIFDLLLDSVQLADLADGNIRLTHLMAFLFGRCRLAGLEKFPPRMIPASDSGNRIVATDLVVTGIVIRKVNA